MGPRARRHELVDGAPSADAYRDLRRRAGLSPVSASQAAASVAGSWAACHVVLDGRVIGMGRVIGDGGWYFHIIDMAVVPEHQRKGIGDEILTHLLDRIRTDAPPNAFVTLLADPPGRRLYKRHGFRESAPHSIGMVRRVQR